MLESSEGESGIPRTDEQGFTDRVGELYVGQTGWKMEGVLQSQLKARQQHCAPRPWALMYAYSVSTASPAERLLWLIVSMGLT